MVSQTLPLSSEQIIQDYRLAYRSRQASIIGHREVMSGKAKFGIFGAGKEVPQVAMAHFFEKGDFRSGYYRDQTLAMALGAVTVGSLFAQLYAHTDLEADPSSGGRQMDAHFATRSLNADGSWKDLTQQYNVAADIAPTAGQMPRLVGLAQASRLYREVEELRQFSQFSHNGNEVAFGTIGNASTAEGPFWETLNAIGVLGAPAVISIWDDGYGISVSNEHQILKQDLSALLCGFQREGDGPGYDIYTVPGWDYPALLEAYQKASANARQHHVPAIIHVIDLTQPQGHSTSGSHQRYKSAERLDWEKAFDCLSKMRSWLLEQNIISPEALAQYEKEDLQQVRSEQKAAWLSFVASIDGDRKEVAGLIDAIARQSVHSEALNQLKAKMFQTTIPLRRDILSAIFETLKLTRYESISARQNLIDWRESHLHQYQVLFSDNLYSHTAESPMNVIEVKPEYTAEAENIPAFELLNRFFKTAFARDPRIVTFGEDVGFLGGVNQTMAGMQTRFGAMRVADTGIREATIMGQAIGLAMRGLRPIAEIQYLDYILYGLQTMSDDLATLRWRTRGGQKAPVIIRTRGHRLEGVWHSGSPMGAILHLARGIHVLVPRDMTRAVGFYNTLLQGDDPALVVEVLNGYRKREALPSNLSEISLPLGVPETLREGRDLTLLTYGPTCFIALQAAETLNEFGIEVEVIDVQSLLPFDTYQHILKSVQKTRRLICVDEDVPGGASAYILQQVLEKQGGYQWLNTAPRTLTAQAHRPAYGSDGDYFSKPNAQTIFQTVYEMMHDSAPTMYPKFYQETQAPSPVKRVSPPDNSAPINALFELYAEM